MEIKTALVVDDSRVASLSLGKMLTKRAIEVDTVASGEHALEYLKRKQPSVIFMDILMPGMDGYQAAQAIASSPEISDIPVIMCSSKDSPEDRQKAFVQGAKGFIVKPVTEDGLDRVLGAVKDLPRRPIKIERPAAPPVQPTYPAEALHAFTENQARAIADNIASEVAETVANSVAATTAHAVAQKVVEEVVTETTNRIAREVVVNAAQKILPELSGAIRDSLRKELEEQAMQILRDQTTKFLATDAVKNVIVKLVENSASSVADAVAKKVSKQIAEDTAQRTAKRVAEETVTFVAGKTAKRAAAATMRATIFLAAVVVALVAYEVATAMRGTLF